MCLSCASTSTLLSRSATCWETRGAAWWWAWAARRRGARRTAAPPAPTRQRCAALGCCSVPGWAVQTPAQCASLLSPAPPAPPPHPIAGLQPGHRQAQPRPRRSRAARRAGARLRQVGRFCGRPFLGLQPGRRGAECGPGGGAGGRDGGEGLQEVCCMPGMAACMAAARCRRLPGAGLPTPAPTRRRRASLPTHPQLDAGAWEVCLQDYGVYRTSSVCGNYLSV